MPLNIISLNALQATFIGFFALLTIGGLTLLGFGVKNYIDEKVDVKDFNKDKNRWMLYGVIASLVAFIALITAIVLTLGNGQVGFIAMAVGGALIFGLSLLTFVISFFIHFYKLNPLKIAQKQSFRLVVISGIVTLLTLFVLLDGLVYLDVITFPLMNKIYFDRATNRGIAFYALFILAGALLALGLADHEMYKKYKRHGLLENVFYIAFPAGIVGARIWFVIGDWYRFADDPISMLYIWEGGLAIMGGALLGIIVGVAYIKLKRKELDVFFVADMVVPMILLAQAVGRWGNFFNQEVYGARLDNMNAFFFLPEFVKQNMFIAGSYRVPLFFIEFLINIAGYFVIRYGIGVGLKKYKQPLDMAIFYAVWYGLTRVVLEPLRDPSFNMGTGGEWSYIWGYVFAAAGLLAIVGNHLVRYYIKKKQAVE